MAVTSGTVYTNQNTSEGNTRFYVTWTQTSQSTTNNTTTIHWEIWFENHWEYYTNAVKINSLVIDGTTVYTEHTYSNLKYQTVKLAEGDTTITHGSDGKKTFSMTLTCWTYSSTTYTGTGSFELTQIMRGIANWGVNGSWKPCMVYWGVNGTWKQCLVYYGVNGQWKQVGGS